MTGTTIHTKAPQVLVIRAVAEITILRGCCEIDKLTRVYVTLLAGWFPVFSYQLELEIIVVEARAKPIYSIVAVKTCYPVGQEVRLGKDSIHLTVAGLACVRCEDGNVILMTVSACERFIPDREPVSVQRESQQLMRELLTRHDSERCIFTTVFRVTIPAFQFRIGLIHRAMQSDHALHLLCYFAMAVDTQVCHRNRTPRGTMTGFTLTTDFSMGSNPT